MNSKLVTFFVVQFMLAGVPLNRPADAQERFQEPAPQCDLNRKPSQDCLSPSDTERARDTRPVRQGSIGTQPLQVDLLRELLPPSDGNPGTTTMTNEIETQESGLLEKLLAESAMP